MTFNRVKRAITFMKYLASVDFLIFLSKTLIWNKYDSFTKKVIVDKGGVTDTKIIAKTFNNIFVKIGLNLPS